MKALALFRLVYGVRWRIVENLFNPAAEIFMVIYTFYSLAAARQQTLGGVMLHLGYSQAVVVGVMSRLWASQKYDVLVEFFSATCRQATPTELIFGVVCAALYVWNMYFYVSLQSDTLLDGIGEVAGLHVTSFRFMWICYIWMMVLSEASFRLRHCSAEASVASYRECCHLLEFVNATLAGVHDWLLFSAAISLAVTESLATVSECDITLYALLWGAPIIVSLAALVNLGEQIATLMHEKRVRVRRMWTSKCRMHEVFTIGGHSNALGIRWMAKTAYMNYFSVLSVASKVFAYASLILTTPVISENSNFDYYCPAH